MFAGALIAGLTDLSYDRTGYVLVPPRPMEKQQHARARTKHAAYTKHTKHTKHTRAPPTAQKPLLKFPILESIVSLWIKQLKQWAWACLGGRERRGHGALPDPGLAAGR
jgi:hypothetical protein